MKNLGRLQVNCLHSTNDKPLMNSIPMRWSMLAWSSWSCPVPFLFPYCSNNSGKHTENIFKIPESNKPEREMTIRYYKISMLKMRNYYKDKKTAMYEWLLFIRYFLELWQPQNHYSYFKNEEPALQTSCVRVN